MIQHTITNQQNKPAKPRWLNAFTLIELTLVIAVVAVLMLIGAQFYKQQREHNAVKQTAVEMQQIAQAAQTYYVSDTNNYWPTDVTKLNGVKPCGPLFLNDAGSCGGFNSYTLSFPPGYEPIGLPNTGQTPPIDYPSAETPPEVTPPVETKPDPDCPFGPPMCWCPPGSHMCFRTAPPKASAVIVTTTTPNANIAKQLATLLPMAKVDGTKVSITMPAPTETPAYYTLDDLMNDQEVIMIKSIYTTLVKSPQSTSLSLSSKDNKATVTLPQCPKDWTPGYDTALTQTIVNRGADIYHTRGVFICRYEYAFTPKDSGKNTDFVVKSDRKTASDYYSALVLVVTYCVPPNAVDNNTNLINRFLGYTPLKKGDPDSCRFANFIDNGNS